MVYKQMYTELFNRTTDEIARLQLALKYQDWELVQEVTDRLMVAQIIAEDIYMNDIDANVSFLKIAK